MALKFSLNSKALFYDSGLQRSIKLFLVLLLLVNRYKMYEKRVLASVAFLDSTFTGVYICNAVFFFVQHVEPNLNLCTNLFCAVLIAILFVPCLYSYLLKLLYAYLLLHNINSCASQQKLNIAQSKLLKKSGHFFSF